MIPNDPYTQRVIVLLALLGLLGLLRPRWFLLVSRFPFLFTPHPPIDEAGLRRARLWGVISLLGAASLVVLSG